MKKSVKKTTQTAPKPTRSKKTTKGSPRKTKAVQTTPQRPKRKGKITTDPREITGQELVDALRRTREYIAPDCPEDTDWKETVPDYLSVHSGKEFHDCFFSLSSREQSAVLESAFPSRPKTRRRKASVKKTTTPPRKKTSGNSPIDARVKKTVRGDVFAKFLKTKERYGLNAALGELEKGDKSPDGHQAHARTFWFLTGLDFDEVAEKLNNLAGKHGITPRAAAKFEDIQLELGLSQEEITDDLIRRAEHFDREGDKRIKGRLEKINGRRKKKVARETPPEKAPQVPEKTSAKKSKAGTPAKPKAKREAGGPSNKEVVYKAWKKSPSKQTPESLHELVNENVKFSTIKSWLSMWGKGKGLPACAKE